jgi:hypothetical protein
VNGVNDGRYPQRPGGKATKDTAFGTVGVNNVRSEIPDGTSQLAIGDQVVNGMNWAAQTVDHLHPDPKAAGLLDQAAFRSQGWSRDQKDIVSVMVTEVAAAEHGIFLRTAKYQSRDDVDDAHES